MKFKNLMNRLIVKVLNKFRLLHFININVAIYINNIKVYIPILGRVGIPNLTISEQWMIDLLKIVLEKFDGTFIDIGVNVGQTLLKLRCVNEKVEYIGFEPNSSCVFYSNKLIQINKFKNCTVIPVGISNITSLGILNFQNNSATDSGASIIPEFRSKTTIDHTEYIPLFEINQIDKIININEFAILKIDVEGAELEVLISFYDLIMKHQPIILLEILPVYNSSNRFRIERQTQVISIIFALNYSIFRVIKENDKFIGLQEVIEIEIHSDLNKCDYVLISKFRKAVLSNYLVTAGEVDF